jgi:hypothetical protein
VTMLVLQCRARQAPALDGCPTAAAGMPRRTRSAHRTWASTQKLPGDSQISPYQRPGLAALALLPPRHSVDRCLIKPFPLRKLVPQFVFLRV